MKHRCVLGTAALALVITACTAAPAGLTPEDEAAIRATFEAWEQAERTVDWDAGIQLFTEDAIFMPPNEPSIVGSAAVRAWWDTWGITETLSIAIPVVRIEGRGDLAVVECTFTSSFVMESLDEPWEDTGKILAMCRKQADDSWLIAVVMYNSDLPLPE